MLERHWPGNVRELRNAIERAMISRQDFIEASHLPAVLTTSRSRSISLAATGTTVEEAERRLIVITLQHTRKQDPRGRNPGNQPQDAAQ